MSAIEQGHLRLGTLRGVPVRVHWTTPVGALFFTGFRFEPGAWLGFFLLVLIHEMGHAALVMRYRLHVLSVDIHGYGGVCRWAGQATGKQRAVIAWGGVLAQGLLFGATWAVLTFVRVPRSELLAEIAYVFTSTNLYLAAINLLPFPPLDGANAWTLFRELRRPRRMRPPSPPSDAMPLEPAEPELSAENSARIKELFDRVLGKKP